MKVLCWKEQANLNGKEFNHIWMHCWHQRTRSLLKRDLHCAKNMFTHDWIRFLIKLLQHSKCLWFSWYTGEEKHNYFVDLCYAFKAKRAIHQIYLTKFPFLCFLASSWSDAMSPWGHLTLQSHTPGNLRQKYHRGKPQEKVQKSIWIVGMFERYLELFWGKPAVELLSAGKEGLGGSPGDI